jgi:hypothetical protein
MLANALFETAIFFVSTDSDDPVDCGITPSNCFTLLKKEIDAIGKQPGWIGLVIVPTERLRQGVNFICDLRVVIAHNRSSPHEFSRLKM